MGDQNFSIFDSLFSDLGTEFAPELREKEVGSSAPPLGDISAEPLSGGPTAEASSGPSDDGYDIDTLLAELDGEGFTSEPSSGPEYLDLGGSEPAVDDIDFSALQQEAGMPTAPAPAPAGPSELDALLGDFAETPQQAEIPPAEPAAPEPAPEPFPEPPPETGPVVADDEMADFLDALEDVGPESQDQSGFAPQGEDIDFLSDLESGGPVPDEDDFLSELEGGAPAPEGEDFYSEPDSFPAEEEAFPSGDDDFLGGFEETGAPSGGDDFLSALDEEPAGSGDEDFLAALEGDAGAPMAGDDDLLGDLAMPLPGPETAPGMPAGMDETGFTSSAGDEELDLSDEDLIRIQKRILILTPALQDGVRRAIVEATLPPASLNMLIRMLLAQRTPQEIRDYLEEQTGRSIVEEEPEVFLEHAAAAPGRSKGGGGLENILPILRIGALLGGIFILGLLLFLLVIKPGIDAKDNYKKGLVEITRGNWKDAENYFKKGEGLNGKDVDWYIRYGLAYRKKEMYPWAIKKFSQGLKVEPGHFRAWMLLGETYAMDQDLGNARKVFTAMQKAYPDNLRVQEKIGDLFILLGDRSRKARDEKLAISYYDTARGYYAGILKKDWDDLGGQFKMLRTFIRLDRERFVTVKLEHIRRINKDAVHVPIYTEAAEYFQKKKKWDVSQQILKRVLGKDRKYALANYYMARYYHHVDDWPRAIKYYKWAIEDNSKDPRFFNDLGEVYMSLPVPNQELAREAFEKSKALDLKMEKSSYYKPYVNLGFLFYEKIAVGSQSDLNLLEKNYGTAMENFDLATTRLKPYKNLPADFDSARFYYYYGWLHYRLKRIEKAVELWNKVYMQNPFHPVVSFAMGNGYLHLKKYDLAIPEFRKNIQYFNGIAGGIPEISPGNSRHRQVIEWLSFNYNNVGVAYALKSMTTRNPDLEKRALQSFYRARELGDKLVTDTTTGQNDYAWQNINAVLKPERKLDYAIAPERLSPDRLPRFLKYPRP